MEAKALLIDACNFVDFPLGGQMNFARQMAKVLGEKIALVGISTDDTPVGVWTEREFAGTTHMFFSFARRSGGAERPFVPARFSAYLELRRHRAAILSLGVWNAFIQAPEVALAVSSWQWEHLCYRFAGVENPLWRSRYRGASLFARAFDAMFFRALRNADVLLAAADVDAINEMIRRSNGAVAAGSVVQFPTRVDVSVFSPTERSRARQALELPSQALIVVTCGRISAGKGWRLLLEAFAIFGRQHGDSCLYFIGDGEDRVRLQSEVASRGLSGRVHVTGYRDPTDVARFLSAADLFVFASLAEGWPTALVEALACHKPIVTSDVSGARDIVRDGENGFVIADRDPSLFAIAMNRALQLRHVTAFSEAELPKYSLEFLAEDIGRVWSPFRV